MNARQDDNFYKIKSKPEKRKRKRKLSNQNSSVGFSRKTVKHAIENIAV